MCIVTIGARNRGGAGGDRRQQLAAGKPAHLRPEENGEDLSSGELDGIGSVVRSLDAGSLIGRLVRIAVGDHDDHSVCRGAAIQRGVSYAERV
jgi:hypothetical protein